MMTTRREVVTTASSLMQHRLRFRPYGRNPEYGMDCVGVVIWVGRELDILEHKRIPPYSFPPSTENFEHLAEFLDETDTIREGTIIIFLSENKPAHAAIAMHNRDGVWTLFGSIPGTLNFGEFSLIPTISDNVWRMFDYRDVE